MRRHSYKFRLTLALLGSAAGAVIGIGTHLAGQLTGTPTVVENTEFTKCTYSDNWMQISAVGWPSAGHVFTHWAQIPNVTASVTCVIPVTAGVLTTYGMEWETLVALPTNPEPPPPVFMDRNVTVEINDGRPTPLIVTVDESIASKLTPGSIPYGVRGFKYLGTGTPTSNMITIKITPSQQQQGIPAGRTQYTILGAVLAQRGSQTGAGAPTTAPPGPVCSLPYCGPIAATCTQTYITLPNSPPGCQACGPVVCPPTTPTTTTVTAVTLPQAPPMTQSTPPRRITMSAPTTCTAMTYRTMLLDYAGSLGAVPVTVDQATGVLYAAAGKYFYKIDPTTLAQTARLTLGSTNEYLTAVAISGNYAYVGTTTYTTNQSNIYQSHIYRIYLPTFTQNGVMTVDDAVVHDIVVDSAGRFAFFFSGTTTPGPNNTSTTVNRVSRMNAATMTVDRRIILTGYLIYPNNPGTRLFFDRAGTSLFVDSYDTIARYNLDLTAETGRLSLNALLGNGPWALHNVSTYENDAYISSSAQPFIYKMNMLTMALTSIRTITYTDPVNERINALSAMHNQQAVIGFTRQNSPYTNAYRFSFDENNTSEQKLHMETGNRVIINSAEHQQTGTIYAATGEGGLNNPAMIIQLNGQCTGTPPLTAPPPTLPPPPPPTLPPTPPIQPQPPCGNGVPNTNEQCDDGNTASGDGCTSTCQAERCGDGSTQPPERCDDGNMSDFDLCNSRCTETICGDRIVQSIRGETCDDGNTNNTDACSNTCRINPTTSGTGVCPPFPECAAPPYGCSYINPPAPQNGCQFPANCGTLSCGPTLPPPPSTTASCGLSRFPSTSGDGQRTTYETLTSNAYNIYLRDGNTTRFVTAGNYPTISSNGSAIAFAVNGLFSDYGVYDIATSSKMTIPVPFTPAQLSSADDNLGQNGPLISEDGRYVVFPRYYSRPNGRAIIVYDRITGTTSIATPIRYLGSVLASFTRYIPLSNNRALFQDPVSGKFLMASMGQLTSRNGMISAIVSYTTPGVPVSLSRQASAYIGYLGISGPVNSYTQVSNGGGISLADDGSAIVRDSSLSILNANGTREALPECGTGSTHLSADGSTVVCETTQALDPVADRNMTQDIYKRNRTTNIWTLVSVPPITCL